MLRAFLTALLAVAGLLAGGQLSTASARTQDMQHATSENWAGYVLKKSAGAQHFTSVSGNWVQPSVTGGGLGDGYSGFWVGLGGSTKQSGSLEQIGTDADYVKGQAKYYAWYEIIPAPPVTLKLAIHPGDHISSKVTVAGKNVTLSLANQTTGASATKKVQMKHPDTSSAEWIAEAPSKATLTGDLKPVPLANFGKVTFTQASATADGHTGPISDPRWTVQKVELAPSSATPGIAGSLPGIGGTNLGPLSGRSSGAKPSALSRSGSAFSVSWLSNRPTQPPLPSIPGAGGGGIPGVGVGVPGLPPGMPGVGAGGFPGAGAGPPKRPIARRRPRRERGLLVSVG